MFSFSHPLYAFRLYMFGRRLAEFRLQSVLKGLPLPFWMRRSCRKTKKNLPEKQEEHLKAFLTRYGIPEQTLAFYLSLHPDVTGEELSCLLDKAVRGLLTLPESFERTDQKRAEQILELFYALCLEKKKSKESAELFERLLNSELDFRLEAAALERLNDSFYEQENICAITPDWPATTKERLVLTNGSEWRPLSETPDKLKTATALIRSVVLMLLRDGMAIIPSPAACRSDDRGNLCFIRARIPLFLSEKELLCLRSLTEAVIDQNYPAAAKTLSFFGYNMADTVALLKKNEEETNGQTLATKARLLVKRLSDAPYFLRYGAAVLKATEDLCREEFGLTDDLWRTAAEEFAQIRASEKTFRPTTENSAAQFRQVFCFAPHQQEQLTVQSKKLPSFQKDSNKISEILFKQTVSARFLPKRRHPSLFILLFLIACVLAGLIAVGK